MVKFLSLRREVVQDSPPGQRIKENSVASTCTSLLVLCFSVSQKCEGSLRTGPSTEMRVVKSETVTLLDLSSLCTGDLCVRPPSLAKVHKWKCRYRVT